MAPRFHLVDPALLGLMPRLTGSEDAEDKLGSLDSKPCGLFVPWFLASFGLLFTAVLPLLPLDFSYPTDCG